MTPRELLEAHGGDSLKAADDWKTYPDLKFVNHEVGQWLMGWGALRPNNHLMVLIVDAVIKRLGEDGVEKFGRPLRSLKGARKMTNEILVTLLSIVGLALIIALLSIGIINNKREIRELEHAIEAARRLQEAFERFDNSLNQILDDADASSTKEHEK